MDKRCLGFAVSCGLRLGTLARADATLVPQMKSLSEAHTEVPGTRITTPKKSLGRDGQWNIA